jgi:hypothetical protein
MSLLFFTGRSVRTPFSNYLRAADCDPKRVPNRKEPRRFGPGGPSNLIRPLSSQRLDLLAIEISVSFAGVHVPRMPRTRC